MKYIIKKLKELKELWDSLKRIDIDDRDHHAIY